MRDEELTTEQLVAIAKTQAETVAIYHKMKLDVWRLVINGIAALTAVVGALKLTKELLGL